ncbi:MAG: Rpn family recombination-promoting nuclease/putative transposase [Ruminococcus sp.]|nr:Rpn family recombination-promoting nuclease/putative transposase [Ruminococcus sp.]
MARDVIKAKTDIVFKKLFTDNIDLLTSFLSSTLKIPEKDIGSIRIMNTELTPETVDGKFSRLDINMEVDGRLINVEVQVNDEGNYRERSLYYWGLLYCSGIKKGETYDKLKQTITVNVLDFDLFDRADYHYSVKPVIEQTGEIFSDKMEVHFFELPKLPEKIDNENLCELWLKFLDAESEEEYEMIRETNNPVMQKAVKVIYDMSEDVRIREAVRMREKALHDEASALGAAEKRGEKRGELRGIKKGREEGRKEGRKEGREEGMRKGMEKGIKKGEKNAFDKVAAEMRKQGMSEDFIAALIKGAENMMNRNE